MRYIVKEIKLDKDHPQWPGVVLFKIYDRNKGWLSESGYTTLERAQEVARKKNDADS